MKVRTPYAAMTATVFAAVLASALINPSLATAGDFARVTGSVTDASTGSAVSGARIVLREAGGSERTIVSGKDGRYSALGVISGTTTVFLERDGYETEGRTYSLPAGESMRCDFSLYRPLRVITSLRSRNYITDQPICRVEPDTFDTYVIQ